MPDEHDGDGADLSDLETQTAGVDRYVTFVGYPRSGHSLVGSLLDAHPNIIISHEANALSYLIEGWDRARIWAAILRNSREYAKRGRTWQEFAYAVPGQWNGRFRDLRVIGDKKGGRSSLLLRDRPELLTTLAEVMKVRCQFIHVTRNPFDNISTIARRSRLSLPAAIDFYFGRCDVILNVRANVSPENWFDLRHEELIRDAAAALKGLCDFLEQPCPDDYVRDCASTVYDAPHQSRLEAAWTPELISDVIERQQRYPYLEGYRFED